MSYLQALNAGLLNSSDAITPTLDVVLTNGSSSSESITLTGTGSIGLIGTGDITMATGDILINVGNIDISSGNITIESGSLELGSVGQYGTISGDPTSGIVITSSIGLECNTPINLIENNFIDFGGYGSIEGDDLNGITLTGSGTNNFITLNSPTKINYSPLYFGYSGLSISTNLGIAGGSTSFFIDSLSLALTGDSSWRQLYVDTNTINVGIYMVSIVITYDTTDAYTIGNVIYFAVANTGTTTPYSGNKAGSPLNTGSIAFCIPYTETSSNNLQFVYYTNMSNISVTSISWTYTRIG